MLSKLSRGIIIKIKSCYNKNLDGGSTFNIHITWTQDKVKGANLKKLPTRQNSTQSIRNMPPHPPQQLLPHILQMMPRNPKYDQFQSKGHHNENKANLRDLIAATGLVNLLKLDLNRRFFSPCDLEIWWMTLKNNRAPLLYYFKLCASFRSHWWIQTGVTVWKRPIWVKFDTF